MKTLTVALQKPDDPAQGGMLQPAYRPRKGPSLLQRDLRDGCVLHDKRTGIVYTLNTSASFILTFCTGDYPLEQIAVETATAFGLRPEEALRDVVSIVQTLRNEGLLDPGSIGNGQGLL
jgi:hypothetical protein